MSKSNENEAHIRQVQHRRPTVPMPSITRLLLFFVGSTVVVGQASILKELGIYAGHADLYQLAMWALFTWALWPQIAYGLNRGLGMLATYFDNKQDETNV